MTLDQLESEPLSLVREYLDEQVDTYHFSPGEVRAVLLNLIDRFQRLETAAVKFIHHPPGL